MLISRITVLCVSELSQAEVFFQLTGKSFTTQADLFSLDHNDGQFFRAMEWLMFFFGPPLPSMVFQWF